jgi:hypothetical protein
MYYTFTNNSCANIHASRVPDPTAPSKPPQGLIAKVKALRNTEPIRAGTSFISLKQHEILKLPAKVARELERFGLVQITEK